MPERVKNESPPPGLRGTFPVPEMTYSTADPLISGAVLAPHRLLGDQNPADVVNPVQALEREEIAAQRIRNDEVLLTRQAREIAALEGVIGRLENELDQTEHRLREVVARPLTEPTLVVEAPRDLAPIDDRPVTYDVVEQTTVVQPTVYTNLGSLLDVFA